ncbi:MAG: 2TM domain-containing protein [Solirubrobacterales bacterium]
METAASRQSADGGREEALKRIKARRDFRSHVVVYALVNAALWTVWVVLGVAGEFTFPWPLFVTLGWGIAVLINAWEVYGRRPITEEEIQAEMRKR